MENSKYLLYIDVLGFSNLAKSDYSKVQRLFAIIDSLNAHKHPGFQTVVFSDTILILNKVKPVTLHDHEYIVMYSCEFAQDLIFRCRELDIQFRAILTYGDFFYERLKNIEAYHGNALINAYNKEKDITGLWLYIDKKISKFNTIFASTPFDNDLDFVFLLQDIEGAKKMGIEDFPIDWQLIDPYFLYNFKEEVEILKTLKHNTENQVDSKIRAKYLQTYYLFKTRYKSLIEFLEQNNFQFQSISPDANWER
jgi:hypothetical protein